jgi:hypothetical protein
VKEWISIRSLKDEAMPIRQLPDPQDMRGIYIDGVRLQARGWRHERTCFAFSTEPGPECAFPCSDPGTADRPF